MSPTLSYPLDRSIDFLNLNLAARTASEVIRELHDGVSGADGVTDSDSFLQALFDRQALGVNCLDAEIALPHARTTAVSRFILAIGRSANGVAFEGQYPAIRLVLLIGVPRDAVSEYLRWTAYLIRSLRSETFRQALLTARSEHEFHGVWSLTHIHPGQSASAVAAGQ